MSSADGRRTGPCATKRAIPMMSSSGQITTGPLSALGPWFSVPRSGEAVWAVIPDTLRVFDQVGTVQSKRYLRSHDPTVVLSEAVAGGCALSRKSLVCLTVERPFSRAFTTQSLGQAAAYRPASKCFLTFRVTLGRRRSNSLAPFQGGLQQWVRSSWAA